MRRSAERRSGAAAPVGHAITRHVRRLARRLASHNAGRSPLGAPPWRFFTRGRASVSGIASGSVQRAPRGQVVVPGGRLPGPPEANGYEPPAAGRHASLRLQDRLRTTPLDERGCNLPSTDTLRSQEIYSKCSRSVMQPAAARSRRRRTAKDASERRIDASETSLASVRRR